VRDNAADGVTLDGPLLMVNSVVTGNGMRGITAGVHWGPPVDIRKSTVSDNAGDGIYNRGTMTLTDSTVSGNAERGIWNVSSLSGRGVLTVVHSTISGNTGGGMLNHWQASIIDSKIMNNITIGIGGGIANINEGPMINFRGVLSITGSKVMGNTASQGGGIYNSDTPGALTLDNVKIKNNTPDNCVGC
jgi:hypothetical protein